MNNSKNILPEDGKKYEWPSEMFDENGMLRPGNEVAEKERNQRIRDALWPMFEMRNISDAFILASPVKRIRDFFLCKY